MLVTSCHILAMLDGPNADKPVYFQLRTLPPWMESGLPYRNWKNDSAQYTQNRYPCCFVSAGAHDVAAIARASSEAASGSGLSPGAVRDPIQATVSLVTHAAMAWGASVFFRHAWLGGDADVVQPGGILLKCLSKRNFLYHWLSSPV